MDKLLLTQLKAIFLIIVFSLNTIIGFACALGIEMGFNISDCHETKENNDINPRCPDGEKHCKSDAVVKHADQSGVHQKTKTENGGCCNDKVMKFNELDKLASHSLNSSVYAIFFSAVFAFIYKSDIFYTTYITGNIKYFVRGYHPPIPDIRIAINSFQI
ncbi:MAG: hypothetical protein ABI416_02725 [Ginsengibacter sp.]